MAQKPPSVPPRLPLGGGDNGPPENLIPIDIEVEMKKSYLDYAMSVIIGRALPDVRDGLKPVQRRILYGMLEAGLRSNRGYRKCAKIVGEVMGNYHPHGDSSIYDTLVRMAQPFSMRAVLVDGQGNFGSVDNDPPAAMRYTEARLTAFAEELLNELDQDTVDFRANYDDTSQEPEYLPAGAPNLFVNGASGIAVGMATNIPPHNLTEMLNAAIHLVKKPKATLDEMLAIVQGPDFPTGGLICGNEGILNAYRTGRGHMTIRARAKFEDIGKDRKAIVVNEIPYQVNKARLIEHAAGLVNDKKIEGISDIRDESDRDGMRIVFDLKRGEEPEIILNNLFKHTQLQTGYGIIMLAIVGGQPRELGLLDYLNNFVDHRIDVVRRRTNFLLRKAREREHLLLGFQKALDRIDEVIALIRASDSPAAARDGLMGVQEIDYRTFLRAGGEATFAAFDFTQRQAQAIIEMQLQRLTGMERQKILDELAEIQAKIAEYLEILESDTVLRKLIVGELEAVKKKFGDERRTEITGSVSQISIEDLIADEDMIVTVTHNGFLKRTPEDTYSKQTRGGRGRIGMGTRTDDFVEQLFVGSTHSYVLVFTSLGRVYWVKVYSIPDAGTTGKGKHIASLANLQPDEKVQAFMPVREFEEGRFVVMATRKGVVKRCDLTVFQNPLSRGIIALALDEGDELVSARLTDKGEAQETEIFIATYQGKAIRFDINDVRAMGRPARGVRGIRLKGDDHVVGMRCVSLDDLILSVTEEGYGKRTNLDEYRKTARGGQGVINIKTNKRNGNVVAIMTVTQDDNVMIITRNGKIIRIDSDKIRATGRAAQGVRLVKLEDKDQIAAAAVIGDNGDEEEDASNGQGELLQ
ncbi:MAG TPA: DNA gyrase subunit A [Bryobacterales bacterium]|nr:DNA gyrase subunit A [Bryobacterales bacterium]